MISTYFDCNATTPMNPEVMETIRASMSLFGNPSSTHRYGAAAKKPYLDAKKQVADLINADHQEIIISSGGSEANNLAIKGYIDTLEEDRCHIITTEIEHPSVLETVRYLAKRRGVEVTYLPVDKHGHLDLDELKRSIRPDTRLISIMLANNEIGSIQPIRAAAAIAHEHEIFFHTDAVQAVGKLPVDVKELNVDALSLSGHKFGGPKGIGALYLKKSRRICPIIHGGGQENGFRGGTESVLGAIGLGKACALIQHTMEKDIAKIARLKDYLVNSVKESISDVSINAYEAGNTLPNTVSVCIHDIRAEALIAILSENYGIALSSGSACNSHKKSLSHVLTAIGLNEKEVRSSVRISLGPMNSESDIRFLVEKMKQSVDILRRLVREDA